jgi:hypothetical protein
VEKESLRTPIKDGTRTVLLLVEAGRRSSDDGETKATATAGEATAEAVSGGYCPIHIHLTRPLKLLLGPCNEAETVKVGRRMARRKTDGGVRGEEA